MPAPLSIEKVASIQNTLDAGYTGAQTAAIEGVSTAAVSQIRRSVYRTAAHNRRVKVNNIRLLLLDGFTGADIARLCQCSQSYVSKIKRTMIKEGELE